MAQTSVSIRMDADLKRAFDEFCNANASLPCRGGGGGTRSVPEGAPRSVPEGAPRTRGCLCHRKSAATHRI